MDKEKLKKLRSKFRSISLKILPNKVEEDYLQGLKDWERRSKTNEIVCGKFTKS
jgi:hypothetical protein